MNKKQLSFLALFFFLSGCATVGVPNEKLNTLRLGYTKDQVVLKVGEPSNVFLGRFETTSSYGKNIKFKIPFEIWEYYVSGEKKTALLYFYNDQLRQGERLDGHIIATKKGEVSFYDKIPPARFKVNVSDLESGLSN